MKKACHIKLVMTVVSLLCVDMIMAQEHMTLSQRYAMPSLYNAAYIGSTDYLRISLGSQLTVAEGRENPLFLAGMFDMPVKVRDNVIGVGMSVSRLSVEPQSDLFVSAGGAWKVKLWNGEFRAGLQAGYYKSEFKGSKIEGGADASMPATNVPLRDVKKTRFDCGVGMAYVLPQLSVGFSMQHITSPRVILGENLSEGNEKTPFTREIRRTLYFNADGNIILKNTLFKLQPSLLIWSDFKHFDTELSARFIFKDFFWAGTGYRYDDSVFFMIGGSYRDFFLGYSFEVSAGERSTDMKTVHGIVGGYRIKIGDGQKRKYRERSIRIMR